MTFLKIHDNIIIPKMIMNILLILFLILPGYTQEAKPTISDVDYVALIEQKTKLEKKLEDYVNTVLERMLGPEKASCVINITPNVEKSKIETETWAKQETKGGEAPAPPKPTEFLPGIPLKKDLVEKEEEKKEKAASGVRRTIETLVKVPADFIKNIRATLIIDKSVPDEMVSAARDTVIDMLGIDLQRGDKLIIRRVKFNPTKKLLHFLTNPYFWLYFIAALLVLLFLLFLFGPLRKFMFSLLSTLKELKEMPSEVEAAGGGGGGFGEVTGEGEVTKKEEEEEVPPEEEKGEEIEEQLPEGEEISPEELERRRKEFIEGLPLPEEEVGKMIFKPFQWVKDEDLKKLGFLLVNQPPEVVASVLHYLDIGKASRLLAMFPPDKRSEFAIALAQMRLVPQRKLSKLEQIIKRRLDLVSGGIDRLSELLDLMDEETRNRVLEELSSRSPEVAEKARSLVFTFDQLAELDDATLQTILPEISAVDIAIALKNASDEVRERMMGNLTEAARRIVEEEMEAGRAAQASEIAIQEKRRQIIEKVRQLEAEGRISLGGVRRFAGIEPEELTAGEEAIPNLMDEVEKELAEEEEREKERMERRLKELEGEEEEETVLDNDKAFEHFNKGVEYYRDGEYKRSIVEFEESLRYNPHIWQTYQYLGSAFFAIGDEENGLKNYEKSLELNPNNEKLKEWVERYKASKEEKEEAESGETEEEVKEE
ncbi:MAG: hypothetical protein DRI36_01795 [Caldiserica bacterium]|nr:MAG: hypothetical protein DRI36_01795 [Caldisericota bacterium]